MNQYIKNNCWKQHRNVCDYAIVCDIDEFLWINNNTSIKDLLQSYKNKKKSIDYLPTIGYNMVHKNVIDNARSHIAKNVLETIKNSGNDYVLNIPYNPQTNPIESYFSELKHYIKLDSKIEYNL